MIGRLRGDDEMCNFSGKASVKLSVMLLDLLSLALLRELSAAALALVLAFV